MAFILQDFLSQWMGATSAGANPEEVSSSLFYQQSLIRLSCNVHVEFKQFTFTGLKHCDMV